nr:MAG TPA: hypothetical protein [Caudoviricetes sp.]
MVSIALALVIVISTMKVQLSHSMSYRHFCKESIASLN